MRRHKLLWLLALTFILGVLVGCSAGPTSFDDARREGWLMAFLAVFAAGFMTSLTPCVYPMIPIVMGIFGARGTSVSRARALGLASFYVLGMGLMYSGLGVVAALTGKAFGSFLSSPWVVIPLVGFYGVLAASMFGAFELNLPPTLMARLSRVGGHGGRGAFAMGLVGGLTAAPCTGPFLLGILAFVGATRNVPLGFLLLFTFALGMGVLFFALAGFAIALPKSGPWMDGVKSVGGIALLVVGFYFLRPVYPTLMRLTSIRWSFLAASMGAATAGVLVGGVHLSFSGSMFARMRKSAGILLAVVGISGGVNWLLTPRRPLPFRHDEAAVLAEARTEGKPVLLDFGASWCAPCNLYETQVFADPAVHAEVTSRFIALKIDMSKPTDEQDEAQARYKAGLPTVILLAPDGTEHRRFTEPLPTPDEFLAALRTVK